MSKRYGRNQKRRALEQVAALTRSLAGARAQVLVLQNREAELRAALNDIHNALPLGSHLLPAPISIVQDSMTDVQKHGYTVLRAPALDIKAFTAEVCEEQLGCMYQESKYRARTLVALCGHISQPWADDRLHFMLTSSEGQALGYAVSKGVLAYTSRETLARNVAEVLARQFVANLKREHEESNGAL